MFCEVYRSYNLSTALHLFSLARKCKLSPQAFWSRPCSAALLEVSWYGRFCLVAEPHDLLQIARSPELTNTTSCSVSNRSLCHWYSSIFVHLWAIVLYLLLMVAKELFGAKRLHYGTSSEDCSTLSSGVS